MNTHFIGRVWLTFTAISVDAATEQGLVVSMVRRSPKLSSGSPKGRYTRGPSIGVLTSPTMAVIEWVRDDPAIRSTSSSFQPSQVILNTVSRNRPMNGGQK